MTPASTGVRMFGDEELLPISALQHLLFCERQCALIHIEGLWAENRLTVEGRHLHEKAHGGGAETRVGVRITRGVALRSFRLGLVGKADVVEFRQLEEGGVRPYPIEYKRGQPKQDDSDRVQLCAQALCFEEMLDVEVPEGALFYGLKRRRFDVTFDDPLRRRTETAAAQLHDLIASCVTPKARRKPKCDNCSLLHLCLPDALRPRLTAARYLERALTESLGVEPSACES